MAEKYTICFDTICTGYQPIKTGDGVSSDDAPIEFDSEEAATRELESDKEFYADCFVVPMSEIGHKTIYNGEESNG